MSDRKHVNVQTLLEELDAGVFEQKLSAALSEVALGTVTHGKVGKLVIEFTMKRIGESNQVQLLHAIKYNKPTKGGKLVEEDATSTPMHVGAGGVLTLFPDTQTKLELREHPSGRERMPDPH